MNKPHHRLNLNDELGGRYRILSQLGEGGMGSVYLAEDLRLPGKLWAVKAADTLPVTGVDDAAGAVHGGADGRREADTLTRLNHPALPRVVDYLPCGSGGAGYLVMDYIHGENLQERFARMNGRLPVEEVLRYGIQLCDVLDYLHGITPEPVVYRDLKPANVMVDGQGTIRLIDFGTARSFKQGQENDTVQIGTIGFAAPEQFNGLQTDPRTDLYSLGALLYYLLSGGRMYYTSRRQLADCGIAALPAGLASAVDRLLADDPAERIQSAADTRRLLAALAEERIGEADNASAAGQRSRRMAGGSIRRQLIAIGSLYPGAGSTFVTLALARALDAQQVPHAVVEHPLNEPELFTLLDGERSAPKGYVFPETCRSEHPRQDSIWNHGCTAWFPADPCRPAGRWEETEFLKLLYRMEQPVLLVDMSLHWMESQGGRFISDADRVILVADPCPVKLTEARAEQAARFIHDRKSRGMALDLVANKSVAFAKRSEWLKTLPISPVCSLPLVSYSLLADSLWKGQLAVDHPEILPLLQQSLLPLLAAILPEELLRQRAASPRRSIFGWLSK